MLDHIGFGVTDFKRSREFYSRALAPLGYKLVMQVSLSEDGEDGYAGFGDGRPHFWIGTGKPLQSPRSSTSRWKRFSRPLFRINLPIGSASNDAPRVGAARNS